MSALMSMITSLAKQNSCVDVVAPPSRGSHGLALLLTEDLSGL